MAAATKSSLNTLRRHRKHRDAINRTKNAAINMQDRGTTSGCNVREMSKSCRAVFSASKASIIEGSMARYADLPVAAAAAVAASVKAMTVELIAMVAALAWEPADAKASRALAQGSSVSVIENDLKMLRRAAFNLEVRRVRCGWVSAMWCVSELRRDLQSISGKPSHRPTAHLDARPRAPPPPPPPPPTT